MKRYETGIVTAGIVGASAACALGRCAGSAVVLVTAAEREAADPSPALWRGYCEDPGLARLARGSLRMLESFDQLSAGRDGGFRRTGLLALLGRETTGAKQQPGSVPRDPAASLETLKLEVLRREYPQIDQAGIEAAAWERDAGYADATAVTRGLLARAAETGTDIWRSEAVAIRASGGRWLAETADGARFSCRRVLLAAAARTRSLAATAGVRLPLGTRLDMVATVRWGSVRPLPFILVDHALRLCVRPEGLERALLSDLDLKEAQPGRLAARISTRMPGIGVVVRRSKLATQDVSPDRKPLVGCVAPDLFVAAGLGGADLQLGLGLGPLVAEMVLVGGDYPPLERFRPQRFAFAAPEAAARPTLAGEA